MSRIGRGRRWRENPGGGGSVTVYGKGMRMAFMPRIHASRERARISAGLSVYVCVSELTPTSSQAQLTPSRFTQIKA